MAQKRVYKRYFTKEKKALINKKNTKAYEKYLRSNIIKNKDVKDTTYKVYTNYVNQFFVYLSEEWDDVYILDEEFLDEAVDIIEGFIEFCQETLGNNKKVINTKISAISSYFAWATKKGTIDAHPFANRLDRMKGANDEVLISHYFLDDDQIDEIYKVLKEEVAKEKGAKFDIQDLLLWSIMMDSANRNGAISKLTWSSLDEEHMVFEGIREKRGKIVEVPIGEKTFALLMLWKGIREEMDGLECDGIFVAKRNGVYQKMAQNTIYIRVKKIGTIIGLDDLHPHCIRKTAINRVVNKTGDLTIAQELANHSSVETTQKHYVKPKSKKEIRDRLKDIIN